MEAIQSVWIIISSEVRGRVHVSYLFYVIEKRELKKSAYEM